MAQRVKRLPARWETWVRSLGQEDPVEEEMATHSSILAWRTPWTTGGVQAMGFRTPMVGYRPWGCKESDKTECLLFLFIRWPKCWSFSFSINSINEY